MARVIATINLKGGVGKTTTTAALGEFMAAEFGQRVLMIDLDPQTNLTTMMVGEERWQELNELGLTLATLFRTAITPHSDAFDIEKAVQKNVSPVRAVRDLDLLASSLDLMDIQEGLTHQQYADPGSHRPVEVLLSAVRPIADRYDYILIDCPPNLGILTLNGLRLADGYLIPTIPDILSTYGIPPLQTKIQEFATRTGHTVREIGLVITKYRSASNLHRTIIEQLQRDPRIASVVPAWVPEANQIAASAEFVPYGTLKRKYGNTGQYDALRILTETIMMNAQVYL
ncbi:cobyrinic acid a,c-diamide synthase [Rhodococcus pyridinivorans SB3094]|uniref:Cobyrinic acid a,c-diamide synthase n=1 Tax=Rhodococcus pyridinivorans SB3094 TaxID=1435356 RepID=V9XMZ6_9NOCA|nr:MULTISPECIES: AAA family ATPase [Rhodococcus]AHD23345.1 cobyrinic acid a,c-diamide synthase [Rhodococcus pyridinivorans SB3094]MCT7291933.1 AAA family ATPase [Rhodococcus sp. PAE-6]